MAAETLTKTIIVAFPEIHQYFTEGFKTSWDTQVPVQNIDEMWEGLENGSLDADNTEIIMFTDKLMEDDLDEFASAIAQFSNDGAFVLVIYYDINNEHLLKGAVAEKARQNGFQATEFYAVDATADIAQQISDASRHFVAAQEALAGPSPEQLAEAAAAEQQLSYENVATAHAQAQTQAANGGAGSGGTATMTATEEPLGAKRGKLITVTSSKGGSGKSTVSMCTASSISHASRIAVQGGLREEELKVCLVDLDIRDGQIGFYLGQTDPTALNIAIDRHGPLTQQLVADNLVYDDRLGFYALLAPKRARSADYLPPAFYDEVIDVLLTIFDVVILDTSVAYLEPLLSQVALPKSDLVVFVTNLAVSSVYGLSRWLDEVTAPAETGSAGLSKDKIGVVINQSAPNTGWDEDLLMQAANGAELLVSIPQDYSSMVAASNHRSLSDIIFYHPQIAPAYYRLARKLLSDEVLLDPFDEGRKALAELNNQPGSPGQPPQIEKKRGGFFRK